MLTFAAICLVIGFALIAVAAMLYNTDGKRSTSNAFGFAGVGVFAVGFCLLLVGVTSPVGGGVVTREVPIDVEFNGPGVVQPEEEKTLTV